METQQSFAQLNLADKFLYKVNLSECNYYKSCAHINITEYIGIKVKRESATFTTQ